MPPHGLSLALGATLAAATGGQGLGEATQGLVPGCTSPLQPSRSPCAVLHRPQSCSSQRPPNPHQASAAYPCSDPP